MKEKRYTLVLDLYLYARNNNEAKVKSAKLIEELRKNDDNQAQSLELLETPVGSTYSRLIHKGRLEIIENRIIATRLIC